MQEKSYLDKLSEVLEDVYNDESIPESVKTKFRNVLIDALEIIFAYSA